MSFFCNDTATTEIYTLSLHDALPISANLILGDIFGKPAVVTDTHCIRLSNRIGLVQDMKEPAKVERELWKILPPEEANQFCHRLVDHGRAICTARSPKCADCVLRSE